MAYLPEIFQLSEVLKAKSKASIPARSIRQMAARFFEKHVFAAGKKSFLQETTRQNQERTGQNKASTCLHCL
ncbi:hypothetical protein H3S80_00455 [Bartonella sp. M0177]|uniref:hypothetical protein n=1 Tax=Bartonella sp. M0177 TaxID=2750940 RepID=UPI0018DE3D5D|nr:MULTISPECIES: hypothetical protein [Bartonella]MBI0002523.1 hypothetical protein [Bartonella sp. M0177]WLT08628.1 hypothetical protein RAM19_11635 [Bartonella apihabitans]